MQEVSKTYSHRGRLVKALDNVSLEIRRGEFVSVVGPSGSGKSTFLLMLGGMLAPATGQVWLDGQSLYQLSTETRSLLRRTRIGFVFQTFNLVPYLTALENVQVPLYLAGEPPKSQVARATMLLGQVGLGDRLDHKPAELSVGQQQRVALARMLANDPPLILADEPTGNLDPETGGEVLDFLQELHAEGRTVVMVTHDRRAAARSQRVLRLVHGLVEEDSSVHVSCGDSARA